MLRGARQQRDSSRKTEEEGSVECHDGLEVEREAFGCPLWRTEMTKSVQKITLSPSRDIPFNKLVLSQSNVRRVKAGVSIEQLAESIAQRTLLQSLNVRAIVDADGNETGMFEVPAGGRRYRALELLVKQKRMSKTQAVPCVVREGGIAEDDSIAENDERVGLHPLDQFRAFQMLRDLGMSEEDIAARHFVAPAIVKQRLRLASVSQKLHEIYADDGMTLEQLMAFSVSGDHARQEQVWDNVSRSGYDEPYQIRRMLTENTVRGCDRRAQYVGIDAYERAGGSVLHDLFEHDDGGWLQDVALLDRLVTEKLKQDAEVIAAEGWKWISLAVEFPLATPAACGNWRERRPHSASRSRAQSMHSMPSITGSKPSIRILRNSPRRSTTALARSRQHCSPLRSGQ